LDDWKSNAALGFGGPFIIVTLSHWEPLALWIKQHRMNGQKDTVAHYQSGVVIVGTTRALLGSSIKIKISWQVGGSLSKSELDSLS